MSEVNMLERAGSPISAPTFAMLGPVSMTALYHVNPADALVISEALLPRIVPPWPHGHTPAGRRNMSAARLRKTFYGWRVVAAVFVLATFGWGLGFYGPPVYLHTVQAARGWSLALISAAVTTHY